MTRRPGITLLAALAIIAGACARLPQPTGSVTLRFSTGEMETKAGNEDAADGSGIYIDGTPDLKILLVNSNNTVEARYLGTEAPSSASSTEVTVKFTNIPQGEYTVYAFANTGGSLALTGVDWSSVNSKTTLDNLVFDVLSDQTPPSVGSRMPLSATGTLTVNENKNGQIDLPLLRCVAKVEITFKNLTGAPLELSACNITLNDINPNTGYAFQPAGDDATGTARNLVLASNASLSFDVEGSQRVGPLLVFPSVAPDTKGYYACNVSFTENGNARSFQNLPVHDKKSKNIPALKRNQYLKIEIRISKKSDISFNFEVSDWSGSTETVSFD